MSIIGDIFREFHEHADILLVYTCIILLPIIISIVVVKKVRISNNYYVSFSRTTSQALYSEARRMNIKIENRIVDIVDNYYRVNNRWYRN